MVQPSRIFTLWQRLYTRFLIEPLPAQLVEPPGVATTIFPVTQADELLKLPSIQLVNTGNLALGDETLFTVPAGKRWGLLGLEAHRTSEDRAFDEFSITDVSEGNTMPIFVTAAAALGIFMASGKPLPLEDGDQIKMRITGGTTDGTWQAEAFIEEEDAF